MPITRKRVSHRRKQSGIELEDGRGKWYGSCSISMTTDLGGAGLLNVTIGSLPDEVLLEIVTFYMEGAYHEEWIILVHVCRKWRYIVFASPLRLKLQLRVQGNAHVGEMLNVWPALPLVISPRNDQQILKVTRNVIAALEHRDRICRIKLHDFRVPGQILQIFMDMMLHPFPALTNLDLWEWLDEGAEAIVIPDLFLGGSAPLLQSLRLTRVAFPALPKLLLSANHLVELDLHHIPHVGYISPEVMVASLSSMAQLRHFGLVFDSPLSRPFRESRRPPPIIRTALPALTHIILKGVSEYVEDFVARIDAPLLHLINISFFNQLIFDVSQLSQFINRIESFNKLNATVSFLNYGASVVLSSETGNRLLLGFTCNQADWQLSSVAQLCSVSLHPISTSENLTVTINSGDPQRFEQFDIDPIQWVDLLYPFTNAKNLFLAEDVGLHISTALRGLVGESVTQVLPTVQSLSIEELRSPGPTREAAESFAAARKRFGRPVAIHCWEDSDTEYSPDESEQELDSEWESDSDSEVDD